MRVVGNKVILNPGEVVEECPVNPSWAASMIRIYGADADLKGRLGKFSRCPAVLELVPYEVEIEKSAE